MDELGKTATVLDGQIEKMKSLLIKPTRLVKIQNECEAHFEKINSTKSHRDSWLIARLSSEIVTMADETADACQAYEDQIEALKVECELYKRQIK